MMILSEKIEYINEDFKKSKLVLLGDLPDDITKAKEWYDKADPYASDFLLRYKGKGSCVESYAYSLVKDYMETADRIYSEMQQQKSHDVDLKELEKQLNGKN